MTILWPNILGHQQGALNSLLTTIPNRNYRSDRPGGLILYCTALFCTVLYKKRRMKEGKIRKFAYKKRTDKQTDRQTRNSNTETTLSSSSVDNRGSWPIKQIYIQTKNLLICNFLIYNQCITQ